MVFERREAARITETAPHEILRELEHAQRGERLADEAHDHGGRPGDVVHLQLLQVRGDGARVVEAHEEHRVRLRPVEVDAELAQAAERLEVPLHGADVEVGA